MSDLQKLKDEFILPNRPPKRLTIIKALINAAAIADRYKNTLALEEQYGHETTFKSIAVLISSEIRQYADGIGNAELIAKAPTLLAVNQALYEALRSIIDACADSIDGDLVDGAQAAIDLYEEGL